MGLMEFMQSPTGKRVTGVAYSLGASIVIIGALFKIMHWPGAGVMLTIGMGTEAILFAIGIFDKPHKDYHWELVWPELDDEGAEGSAHGVVPAGTDSKELSIPTVDPKTLVEEQLKNLSEGVSKLGNTASQLANLSEAANVSSSYISNVNAASQAAGAFAASQANLKNSSDSLVNSYKDIEASISSASSGSKNFADQMNGINKNISSINSMFEIQAKTASEQGEAMSLVTTALKTVAGSINSSASSAEAYKSLPIAEQMADKAHWWVLIATYFFLTVAELFISPLGLSFVSKVAPKSMLGLCQGLWLGATALGNLLLWIGPLMYNAWPIWQCWTVFAVVCFISMGVMFGMVKWLEKVTA